MQKSLVEGYLIESGKKLPNATNNNAADAKGKAFELHFASHLAHLNAGGDPTNHTHNTKVSHFRDSSGATPGEVMDRLKASIPAEDHAKIQHAAHAAAEHVHKQLTAGGKSYSNPAWTSQPSDHESMTGRADKNASGDVMVQTHDPAAPEGKRHSFKSISLKIGSNEPNLKNAGVASMEKATGAKLMHHADAHMARLHEIGMVGHKAYKEAANTPEQHEQVKAAFGLDSNLHARKEMISDIHKAMSDKKAKTGSDEHIRNFVKAQVAAPTHFPTVRVHAKTDAKTGNLKQIDVHEPDSHMAGLMNDHHDFHTVHTGGINYSVMATHTKTGKKVKISDHAAKSGSGASGFQFTTKLSPYANKYHSAE